MDKEKERARGREKYHRLYKGKKQDANVKKRAIGNYKQNFPEKYKAKNISQRIKPKVRGNQIHHWSYCIEDAKDVIEISVSDHSFSHRHLIYDQEHYKYRALQNVLLETREQHIIYLKKIGVTVEDI